MNGPERDALERVARRLRREHFERIHTTTTEKEHAMHEHHENMSRPELIEALKRAEIGQETYRRLLVDSGHPLTLPEPEPHPLAQIAATIGKPVTVAGDLIEGPNGEPVAVTESTTAPVIGMVVTDREAQEANLDPKTPGLTIVHHETGALISRGDDFEEQL